MTSSNDSPTGQPPPVAILTIRLGFIHSAIDPELITKTLGLKPTRQIRAGYPITGIDGNATDRAARDSRWTLSRKYYDPAPDIDDVDAAGPMISERLATILEPLRPHAAFVRQLAAEGEAWIEINFPGQFHIGDMIVPSVLSLIADLGLELGLEVFPDSAT